MKIKTVLSCVFALLVTLLLLLSFKKTATSRTTPPATFDVRQENIPHGIVTVADYNSTTIGAKQRILIYTPPDYTSARQYPVLYLLHGAGDGEDAWTSSGLAEVILENLYHSKQILPMLVVMPRGRFRRSSPRLAPAQEMQAWAALEDELLKDIIPYVDSHFSVRPEPAQVVRSRAFPWAEANLSTSDSNIPKRLAGLPHSPPLPIPARCRNWSPLPISYKTCGCSGSPGGEHDQLSKIKPIFPRRPGKTKRDPYLEIGSRQPRMARLEIRSLLSFPKTLSATRHKLVR